MKFRTPLSSTYFYFLLAFTLFYFFCTPLLAPPSILGKIAKAAKKVLPKKAPNLPGSGPPSSETSDATYLENPNAACWMDSYGRGVGKPMGCASSEEYDAGLCYSRCSSGYHGVAFLCWRNDFWAWKNPLTQNRGVGVPIHACPDGQDLQAGLCYTKCDPKYDGVGPVCWQKRCPDVLPARCGLVCMRDQDACQYTMTKLASDGIKGLKGGPSSWGDTIASTVQELTSWKKCKDFAHK